MGCLHVPQHTCEDGLGAWPVRAEGKLTHNAQRDKGKSPTQSHHLCHGARLVKRTEKEAALASFKGTWKSVSRPKKLQNGAAFGVSGAESGDHGGW